MNETQPVLLLYTSAERQSEGAALKSALQALPVTVEEMLIVDNYDAVLDRLESAAVPVVVA